jgi:nicotinamide-nucleotide amidase
MKPIGATLKALFLRPPGRTLAVAESLTGGCVQARVTEISGASGFFLGGVTAYTLGQKTKLLGVDRRHAAAVNCVSARVAEEMATGACRLFGADVAVATTGYAERFATADGAVIDPMAWWAIAARDGGGRPRAVRHGRVECPGASRTEVQRMVADAVLGALATWLETDGRR